MELLLQVCDFLELLKPVLKQQQKARPNRTIIFRNKTFLHEIPISVDRERMIAVLTYFLEHALTRSAVMNFPVTVQLSLHDAEVHVLFRHTEPDIPDEDQTLLWERFYGARENIVLTEADVQQELSFPLCRALVELQHGTVGVQRNFNDGIIFWLELPLTSF